MANAPFESFDLTGRTAVVTGGATGLGFQMTRALARAGATVLIGARRENLLREAADKLMEDPLVDKVHFRSVDLRDNADIDAFGDHALETLGNVDIFIGNAAELVEVDFAAITPESMHSQVQTNLLSNVQLVQKFVPGMRARRWGRLIFSSSTNSIAAARLGTAIYATTKAGLNALARELAVEYGHDRITANSLVLGFWLSEMVLNAVEKVRADVGDQAARQFVDGFASSMALGRLGNPEEVQGVINLLASDAGNYITGSNLVIDGGLTTMMFPHLGYQA